MESVKVGSFVGTGAVKTIELGFVPTAFLAFNVTDGDIFQAWFNGMANGSAFQGTNGDTAQFSAVSSNGISAFAGESPGKVLTGALSFTAGSASVSGASTSFLTELKAGDIIRTAGDNCYEVLSVSSATALTLKEASNVTESGVACTRETGRSPGVNVGTTLSESGKTIRYIAFR